MRKCFILNVVMHGVGLLLNLIISSSVTWLEIDVVVLA